MALTDLHQDELTSKLQKHKEVVAECEALKNQIEELTEVGHEDAEFGRDSMFMPSL